MSVNGFPAFHVNGTGPTLQDASISDLPMLPADFDFNGPDSPISVPRRTSQLDEEYGWVEEQTEKLDVIEDPSTPTHHQFSNSKSPSLLKLPLAQPHPLRALTMPLPSQLGDLQNPHRTEPGSPQPLRTDTLPPELVQFHELSLELADVVQTVIQTMLQISPSQVLDPSKEQFSSCSVAVPTPSLSSMFTAMRNLNFISANMASIFSQASKLESAGGDVLPFLSFGGETTFDVGELLQSVGDALGGAAAQVGTELVIFHGDVGFKHVYVKGNESGLSYVLTHIVRQVLFTGKHGDTVELGLYVVSGGTKSPTVDPRSSVDVLTAPEDSDGSLQCKISITHKFAPLDPLHDDSAVTPRPPPDFSTTLLERLLHKVGASFDRTTFNRTVPNQTDLAWEFSFNASPSSPPAPDPASIIIHGLADRPLPSGEPTLAQLSAFAETLRAKKAILYANVKGYFAHYLTSYLTEWGMDVSHAADGVAEASPSAGADSLTSNGLSSPLSFIFIDDDVEVLKSRLVAFRAEQYPLNPPKRPTHRRHPSSNPITRGHNVTGSISSSPVVIVHFTSLGNFKLVRELIQSTLTPFSPVPEIIVVPKPAGPRRFLTALHTVITKPVVDPSFTPIATSPITPGATVANGSIGHTPLPSTSLSGPTRPSGSRSNSERSIRSSKDIPSSPLVRSSGGEYFPVIRCGTTYSGGVVIQRFDGDSGGLFFSPKGSKPATPNTASDNARSSRSSSFSKQEVGQALLATAPLNVSQATPEQLSAFPVVSSRNTLGSPKFRSPRKYSISRSLESAPSAVTIPPDNNVVPPIKVLIVEDNDINQRFIARNLKKMKVKYDAVSDGQAAVEKWRTGEFHLILMDIQMPIMDGIAATKQIRREEKWRALHGCLHGPSGDDMTPLAQTPTETPATTPHPSSVIIVALTAGSMERDRVDALAAGCNDFLVKPVTTVWLNNKVIEWGSIKALQRWAEPDFRSSQAEQARSVAERLVVPEHRRTPPPGQSSTGKTTSTAPHPPPPPPQPVSDVPPTSAALGSSVTSATASTSWSTNQLSPTTPHPHLGVEAPISGVDSSPLSSNHRPPSGSDSNTVNDPPLVDGSVNGDFDGIHGNGSLGTLDSAKSDPPAKEEQNAGVAHPFFR
ncbi:uncharacterized protein EV420DRAFT_1501933 [Desarmillaria tabescens]|uniref:Response regulatory domain-containing protein n=1 Tax=Armillaria tabescens TaxID=1929756 RepID=A0AA39NLN8_ARMTA|nr:uncharacterized protein EV420DRAFT_1501933 [Desarmillaria tabescens]KAK0467916.1 hypothetical protein EV420DRAFT_1501933 [Desarmillaria tabescens]